MHIESSKPDDIDQLLDSLPPHESKDVNKCLTLLKIQFETSHSDSQNFLKQLDRPMTESELNITISDLQSNQILYPEAIAIADAKLDLITSFKHRVSDLNHKRLSDEDYIDLSEVQNLYGQLVGSPVILPEEEKILLSIIETADGLINESMSVCPKGFDEIIERYAGFRVKIDFLETEIKKREKREQAFNLFNTFEGEAQFLAFGLEDILGIEEKIDMAADHRFYGNYRKRILIRKAR
jgi:hypothetical protein